MHVLALLTRSPTSNSKLLSALVIYFIVFDPQYFVLRFRHYLRLLVLIFNQFVKLVSKRLLVLVRNNVGRIKITRLSRLPMFSVLIDVDNSIEMVLKYRFVRSQYSYDLNIEMHHFLSLRQKLRTKTDLELSVHDEISLIFVLFCFNDETTKQ